MHELSNMAHHLQGSQILELAEEIRAKIRAGEEVYNLTIGDFNPQVFPIPKELESEICRAYQKRQTQYPNSNGVPELREAVAAFTQKREGIDYKPDDFLIASGARPLTFACYMTLLDPGDKVVYPVPSWNNNFYTQISACDHITVETSAREGFMPTAELLAPVISDATLLALCSPLNPTGTVLTHDQLKGICELVLAENQRREGKQKPLYVLYDQIYWNLTYGDFPHVNPVSLFPEMRDYTIFIDGISKAFSSTGLRMGWGFGPRHIIEKMKLLIAHIGSWASRPVQMGSAAYLLQEKAVDQYLDLMRSALHQRLHAFYEGFQEMKAQGLLVDAIQPQAALYLTVKLDLYGLKTPDGLLLENGKQVYQYLLNEAGVALVPFYAFGLSETSPWHRLSVGTTRIEDIPNILRRIEVALNKLEN